MLFTGLLPPVDSISAPIVVPLPLSTFKPAEPPILLATTRNALKTSDYLLGRQHSDISLP